MMYSKNKEWVVLLSQILRSGRLKREAPRGKGLGFRRLIWETEQYIQLKVPFPLKVLEEYWKCLLLTAFHAEWNICFNFITISLPLSFPQSSCQFYFFPFSLNYASHQTHWLYRGYTRTVIGTTRYKCPQLLALTCLISPLHEPLPICLPTFSEVKSLSATHCSRLYLRAQPPCLPSLWTWLY